MNNRKPVIGLLFLLSLLLILTSCLGERPIFDTSSNGMNSTNGMSTNMDCGDFPFATQTGEKLRNCLQKNFRPTITNSYTHAWRSMFSHIDNRGGFVRLVYTGTTYSNINNVSFEGPRGASAEHTWPRSRGSDDNSIREADIHHLFPTLNVVNVARLNYAFAEIEDSQTSRWWNSEIAKTNKPLTDIDSYSESTRSLRLFEPREDHKGNVARAMFYFYTIYEGSTSPLLSLTWFYGQTNDLIKWHAQDPVDDYERKRNSNIAKFQGNYNPFILEPSLVDRLF